jgi:pimeloyl-ACP methyl ester carboxylesterase
MITDAPVYEGLSPNGHDDLAWTATGNGTPLLLIAGLGHEGSSWWRSVPQFAERFRVITFDYRGLGRSGPAPSYCSTDDLANDAAVVLDAAGVDRALVYGFSLGGMVAQRLALRHPSRVGALVLGATTAGGAGAVPPSPATVANIWRGRFLSRAAADEALIPHVYGERCRRENPERIAADLEHRRQQRFDANAHHGQMAAAMSHDAEAELPDIAVPTLVVHGALDRLMPPANGERLARRIPGAELHLVPHAGHYYSTDEPAVDGVVSSFLADCD